MPFKKKDENPKGEINSKKYHKTLLMKIIRDETLSANRRLLAEMVLLYLSSTGRKEEVFESILLGNNFTKFADGRGLKANDRNDGTDTDYSKQSADTDADVLNVIGMIERGDAAV
jgi:hypothetical protein